VAAQPVHQQRQQLSSALQYPMFCIGRGFRWKDDNGEDECGEEVPPSSRIITMGAPDALVAANNNNDNRWCVIGPHLLQQQSSITVVVLSTCGKFNCNTRNSNRACAELSSQAGVIRRGVLQSSGYAILVSIVPTAIVWLGLRVVLHPIRRISPTCHEPVHCGP
jgi:hypothetical protein